MSLTKSAAAFLAIILFSAAPGAAEADGPSPISAEGAATLFQDGSEAYEAGRFQEAASSFASILDGGFEDARVHYNLSCALYRLGEIGPAVQHAENALALDPTDNDTRENLDYLRSQTVDRYETGLTERAIALLDRAMAIAGPDALSVVLLVCEILGVFLVALALVRRNRGDGGGFLVPAASGVVIVTLLVAALVGASAWRRASIQEGIILPDKIEALSGPGPTHPALFAAHAGLKVRVRGEREGWVQVTIPSGLSGWIREEELGRVRVP